MSLSHRANELMNNPSAIVEGMILCASDPYSANNKEGYLNFGIAENALMDDYLKKQLNKKYHLEAEHIHYSGMNVIELKRNFTKFAAEFLKITDLDPAKVVTQCGVSAICEAISFNLFDEDDVIMIASPYYTGFEHDFTKRFKCKLLKVQLDPANGFKHDIELFQKTYHEYPNQDKIKAVLICHPHNPTGEIVAKTFMLDIINFVKEHNLQLLSDEIYALSTHWKEEHISLYSLAREAGVKAHLLYGMAKDFAIAGFKVGFYYSEDQQMVDAMHALQYFHPVSSIAQVAVSELLADTSFLYNYIELNQERLNKSKRDITSSLSHFNFIDAGAGLFILLDLSHWCNNMQDELDLHQQMLNELKVNIIKGSDMGLDKPGYFRICFAKPEEYIREFCKRMENLKRTNI